MWSLSSVINKSTNWKPLAYYKILFTSSEIFMIHSIFYLLTVCRYFVHREICMSKEYWFTQPRWQIEHSNGFVISCFSAKCSISPFLCSNPILQIEHSLALISWALSWWFLNFTFWLKLLLHTEQVQSLCFFFPSWTISIWVFIVPFCLKRLPHSRQAKGLSSSKIVFGSMTFDFSSWERLVQIKNLGNFFLPLHASLS